MNKNPIYIVDDDEDDHEILAEVIKELQLVNEVKFFVDAEGLIAELRKNPTVPFLIISDINLPKMSGLELRDIILKDASINHKTIPFIFWSTSASEAQIKEAYDLSAHGFFIKGKRYSDIKDSIEKIIAYWSESRAPE